MFEMSLVNDGIEYTNPRRNGDGLDIGSEKMIRMWTSHFVTIE